MSNGEMLIRFAHRNRVLRQEYASLLGGLSCTETSA